MAKEDPLVTATNDFWIRNRQEVRTRCIRFALDSQIHSRVERQPSPTAEKITAAVLKAAREYEEYIING